MWKRASSIPFRCRDGDQRVRMLLLPSPTYRVDGAGLVVVFGHSCRPGNIRPRRRCRRYRNFVHDAPVASHDSPLKQFCALTSWQMEGPDGPRSGSFRIELNIWRSCYENSTQKCDVASTACRKIKAMCTSPKNRGKWIHQP